jgi:hypothetical protein
VIAAFVGCREQLGDLLASRGLNGRGVEVGVQRGVFSEVILDRSRLVELVLVDPWREFDGYEDVANVAQAEQDAILASARDRLERFGDRAQFWRTTSVEAAARVEDASLDFVYLDARHDYEHVLEDLEAWWPKLKQTGVFAGHDYLDGDIEQGDFGVRSAVAEFCAARNLRAYDTFEERPWSSWIAAPPTAMDAVIGVVRGLLIMRFRARRKARFLVSRS